MYHFSNYFFLQTNFWNINDRFVTFFCGWRYFPENIWILNLRAVLLRISVFRESDFFVLKFLNVCSFWRFSFYSHHFIYPVPSLNMSVLRQKIVLFFFLFLPFRILSCVLLIFNLFWSKIFVGFSHISTEQRLIFPIYWTYFNIWPIVWNLFLFTFKYNFWGGCLPSGLFICLYSTAFSSCILNSVSLLSCSFYIFS